MRRAVVTYLFMLVGVLGADLIRFGRALPLTPLADPPVLASASASP